MSLDGLGLVSLLTTWRHYPRPAAFPELNGKLSVDCWSPATYPPDCARRKKASVVSVSMAVLDFDDGTTIEEAVRAWQHWDLIVHTSWGHTDESPRFRLVLPLEDPVPASHWPAAWRWLLTRWEQQAPRQESGALCGHPDPCCKDASRIYFLPALRPGQGTRFSGASQGYAGLLHIPWRDLSTTPSPRAIRPIRPVEVSPRHRDWTIRRRLDEEPAARRALGHVLEGAVGSELVRHVRCPQCGQPSVWWAIQPERRRTATCNHRQSCGWWGWLFDLAILSGLSVERAA